MESGSLTPIQKDILKLFSVDNSDEFALEIKGVINDYLNKKIEEELDELWEEGVITQEKLDKWRFEDVHEILRKRRNGQVGS